MRGRERNMQLTLDSFMATSGIPILLSVIGFYYAWRLIYMKNLECIRGKDKPPVRKKIHDEYAVEAGKKILIFSIAVVVNAILLWINMYAAFIEILVVSIWLFLSWRKMVEKYE